MAELSKSRLVQVGVGLATVAAVAVGAAFWWAQKQKYEVTDNAFVQADKVAVAPQIDGYVAQVLVGDNQAVTRGQVLARIDYTLSLHDALPIQSEERRVGKECRSISYSKQVRSPKPFKRLRPTRKPSSTRRMQSYRQSLLKSRSTICH